MTPDLFTQHMLNQTDAIWMGALPASLVPDDEQYEALWSLHPAEAHEIVIHGKRTKNPRWEQAFLRDYAYANATNEALPLPPTLAPLLEWVQANIEPALNGLLVVWYDSQKGHYIGKHRDKTTGLLEGAPIVTISLGEEKQFRFRPHKHTPHEQKWHDFPLPHGTVCILPYETNKRWYHEVPHRAAYHQTRISITFRAFVS